MDLPGAQPGTRVRVIEEGVRKHCGKGMEVKVDFWD